MKVIMRWIPGCEKWYMLDHNGYFMEDYFDCRNINRWFPDLDKGKDNEYVLQQAKKVG